jgi:hypothetical protein
LCFRFFISLDAAARAVAARFADALREVFFLEAFLLGFFFDPLREDFFFDLPIFGN